MKQTTLSFASATPKTVKPKIVPKPTPVEEAQEQKEWNPDYSKIFDSVEDFKNCMEPSWRHALIKEFSKPYLANCLKRVREDKKNVLPPKPDVLSAFKLTPFNKVKVVIVGQDPYKNVGQAHGLSFSVRKGVKIPPSLLNVYKELEREYPDFKRPSHGFLQKWAEQGVLMLNATLTLDENESNSHKGFGWIEFTSAAIKKLNEEREGVVYLLWGKDAKSTCTGVNKSKNCVLYAGHPSPLNRVDPFVGCDHFKKCNEYLVKRGETPINWAAINE